jgi:hypothetical protein
MPTGWWVLGEDEDCPKLAMIWLIATSFGRPYWHQVTQLMMVVMMVVVMMMMMMMVMMMMMIVPRGQVFFHNLLTSLLKARAMPARRWVLGEITG